VTRDSASRSRVVDGTNLAVKKMPKIPARARALPVFHDVEAIMAKKLKVPKRIAGVKIPKAIRKGPVGDFLSSSGGQVLLAEALLSVAAYYAARRLDATTPAGEALRHPLDSLRAGRDWSRGRSERLARAFGAGVQAFRATLNESSEPEQSPRAEVSEDAESPRKKRSSRSEAPLRETTSGTH
jgi:hypothetical protein